MTKSELREKYTRLRNALTEEEYVRRNQQISDSFFTHIDLTPVKILHCFLPIQKKREPNTLLILDRLRRDYPSIRISIPKVDSIANELAHLYFESHLLIKTNAWGIPEVEEGEATAVDQIDMVIVPLLAFDPSGHRIGYGKGYYDKFLANCRKGVCKVGLSAFSAEPSIEGLGTHDIALDFCVTPDQFYIF